MSDLIRKAVDLADGWEIDTDQAFDWIDVYDANGHIKFTTAIDDDMQETLDALAAQLVRQVDALDYPVMVIASKDSTSVVEPDQTYLLPNAQPGDRTLNTITAIVESEVLDDKEVEE